MFWGFGEKFTHFNKRGQRIECWQKDALSTNSEDSYKGHPYFTSSRGYSILLNTFTRSSFDMGASSWISYQIGSNDPVLDYIFLAEESKDYKKLLQQYLQLTGQIPMIPQWAFGFWMSKCSYMSRKEIEDVVDKAEQLGVGIDVIHIDGWQKPDMAGLWEWDTERFPDPEGMIRELNKKNIHLSLWNYPYLQENSPEYKALAERGFFIKNKEGQPALFKATADSEYLCACFDFTNPEFLEWYGEQIKKIVRMGVSVIKTDFSEAVPKDVVFYNGMNGYEGHNLLTYLYAKNIYGWMKEICENAENCPFFGDAAVMLVLIQFRQHGQETPPVIKQLTVRSFRPALAWQCPVYPSGVMIWADFIIPVIPEMRSALMQKIIFPLYRWDFGCPYPEHMAKHRESLGSMVIWP